MVCFSPGIWCVADVSSVSPSLEQFSRLANAEKTGFYFKTSLPLFIEMHVPDAKAIANEIIWNNSSIQIKKKPVRYFTKNGGKRTCKDKRTCRRQRLLSLV